MNKILLGALAIGTSVLSDTSGVIDKPLYCFSYEKTYAETLNTLTSRTTEYEYTSIFVCDDYYFEELDLNLSMPGNESSITMFSYERHMMFSMIHIEDYSVDNIDYRIEIYYNVYEVL